MKIMTATAMVILMMGASIAHAQVQYPSKPVRLVIGFGPSSAADIIARVLAPKVQEAWPNGLVIDIKAGAAGLPATQDVARSAPDGYSLLLAANSQISLPPATNRNFPVGLLRELVPITEVANADLSFAVSAEHVPAKSIAEYLAWLKGRPSLFIGDFGAGSITDLTGAYFVNLNKLKYEPVHFKSTADVWTGNFRGDVQGMFFATGTVVPNHKAGKMRVLATTGTARAGSLPDVPTFRELGMGELEVMPWYGMLATSKTPPELLDRINAVFAQASRSPAVRSKLEEIGFKSTGTSRTEFARIIEEDTARWIKVAKAIGFVATD